MRHWLRTHSWLIGVLAIASFAMLFRLNDRPIENWDEGIHGEVSFEMVEDGDWLTPHYAGGTYFRKPSLKLWMSALLLKALPTPSDSPSRWEGEKTVVLALRLPSALAGIATALLVAWWMWQWRRNRWEAFLAGVIVATMRPIFFHAFRTGEMDGLLTFFVIAALYCWWRAIRIDESGIWNLESGKMNWWIALVGAAIGLAVMTKSAAGLLPIPIIAAHALLTDGWKHFRFREFFILTSSFFILVAPWHLAMTWLHGMTFWNDYIGWHVVKRATEVLHNETAGTWWYVPTFARRFTPYSYWFVPALCLPFILSVAEAKRRISQAKKERAHGDAIRMGEILRRLAPQDKLESLLFVWFAIGFLGFTLARTKFDWYLLPLYPAAVMLTVAFLSTARDAITQRSIAFLHLAAIAITVTALPSLYPPGTWLDGFIERWYHPFGHPLVAALVAVIVAIAVARLLVRRFGHAVAARATVITIFTLVLVPAIAVTYRHLVMPYPLNPFSSIAATIRGSHGVLVSFDLDYKQSPAGYLIIRSELRGDVRILDGQHDTARTISMLHEREHGFLLTQRETELPEELRQIVADPRTFGDFVLWRRR